MSLPAAPRFALFARGSLRIRLLAGTLFWIAASIAVAAWGLSSLFREHVATQFHAELKTHLDQLTAQLAVDGKGQATLAMPLSDPRLSLPYSGLYWQVDELPAEVDSASARTTLAGRLRSRSLWDSVLAVPPDAPADGEIHQHRLSGPGGSMLGMVERVIRVEEGSGGTEGSDAGRRTARAFRLIVAADEQLMREPVSRFDGALWLALGILAAGLVVAALVQVIVGLAPLRTLRAALGRVRDGDAQRLEGRFPAEIAPLVDEFNTVLAQNAEVVERARTQAGNLAHALKTPLSVLANAASGKHDELARLIVGQVDTAKRQVDYHLARAQVAAKRCLPGARTPLRASLEALLRTMRRIHAERQLELLLRPFADSLAFRGEEQDLQEILGNLLDNACKWARSRVEVAACATGDRLRITIDDDGQGIATSDRDAVFRRGVRADQQVPGSGLGLSIADDLAQLYAGELSLADSPLGGLRVVLSLPAAGSSSGRSAGGRPDPA
ncbi:MAG: Virulence sensor histidine kinase PhoQ [Candidatus Accumulibacter regalis]|jgi:signal transduction histidine kinase|uniref:histidine kinase n=1 Tax=Accumulibacter regalis TaxID=522306 RepID=A0A011PTM4_ACCRE|nr:MULTISPECIES: ATP-binding protein [unclassified Candidatus Accumulibacter]EXI90756.1 MAG: Virulence sensor histidine kinase PhoQ [Candidatus Accumulibacter regalis]MQM33580.1 ATP-binding protein [Candidatus Accumulibacter phosphatis]MBL8367844.1 ATP-binding protein [Accumulibacter sp.]MBN8514450.1 ATP-binding protein [Accumulibacter sp.]HRE69072.1 ATP-binding protein [Accumulibacter sp.]